MGATSIGGVAGPQYVWRAGSLQDAGHLGVLAEDQAQGDGLPRGVVGGTQQRGDASHTDERCCGQVDDESGWSGRDLVFTDHIQVGRGSGGEISRYSDDVAAGSAGSAGSAGFDRDPSLLVPVGHLRDGAELSGLGGL